MKALYYESKNREPWENERLEFDQIEYEIQNEEDEIEHKLGVLLNEGENSKTLDDYKNSMLQKLKLSSFTFLKIHLYHYEVSILTLLMLLTEDSR